MSLAVGEKAPDFELVGTDPEPFRLSKQLGQKHTVLAFYELAFNNDCTDEMLAFQDLLDEFSSLDASVVGISLDPKGILDSFAGSNGIEFTLLSDDFDPRVCSLYEAWRDDRGFASNSGGMARRMTYVIDRAGVVRGVIEDAAPAEHAERALELVRGLS